MDSTQKRHCWECRRRCLVCDFTRPACKRCSTGGIVCPGYGDKKPTRIRWVAPGLTSRKQKRIGDKRGDMRRDNSRTRTESTTSLLCRSDEVLASDSMTMTGSRALVQATNYFNSCIYEDMVPVQDLGPNPYIYTISPAHIKAALTLPDFIQLGVICMTLGHRINRIRDTSRDNTLSEAFYRYRGLALRSLNEYIGDEHKRTSDIIIVGIMTLLLMDVQQGGLSDWRCHIQGIQRILMMRGGLREVAHSMSLEPLLICFVYILGIGNTTTPASQLPMTSLRLDDFYFVLQRVGPCLAPFQMCPPPIFCEIVKINHLRMLGALVTKEDTSGTVKLRQEAFKILDQVCDFSIQQWARSKPSSIDDWILLGNIFQAAASIYCISSLQSVKILPLNATMKARRKTLAQLLHVFLKDALLSPKLRRFMLWPLVVLGVEAVHDGIEMRAFVEDQLTELSRLAGTYVPLTAKAVLVRFWASGNTSWDSCFNKPYMFTTQIGLDMSRILPNRP